MSTTQNHQPSGELTLIDYFHESSNSHYDKSQKVKLYPGEANLIVLDEFTDECDQFKGPRTENLAKWSIERNELIKLIKNNGTLIK